MPYLTRYGETDLITSYDRRVGLEVVSEYEKQYTLTEIDTYIFTLLAPKVEPQVNELYEIWQDKQLTKKMATVYILSPNREPVLKHPLVKEGIEFKIFKPVGVGPTHFLKRERINITRSNVNIGELAKEIVSKAGVEYGIRDDFRYVMRTDKVLSTVRYVAKTPYEILQRLREYGFQFYVDNDFYFHFFPDKGELVGTIFADDTSYLTPEFVLSKDISELRNAVRITGKEKVKDAPDYKIIGTGDLTNGLDFNLPHNVKFDEELLLENWNDFAESTWQKSDSMGSTSELSPGGRRIFVNNSVLVVDGGNGVQGANYIQRKTSLDREAGTVFIQTLTLDGFGEGYIFAVSDGNGATDGNLMGFYLNTNGTLTIKEAGVEQAPASTFQLKKSYTGGTAVDILEGTLSVDRKTFDLPTGYIGQFDVGEEIVLLSDDPLNSIGVHRTTIAAKPGGDAITLTDAIPEVDDYSGVKIHRVVDYRLKIQCKTTGFIYEIQGGGFGVLGDKIWETVKETNTDDTEFLFCVPAAPKVSESKIQIQDTFLLPTGGATFMFESGEQWLVAPEVEGELYNFPILIRPSDNQGNPCVFRFRPARLISTVAGGTATTTVIPVNSSQWGDIYIGDRLLIDKEETYVTDKTEVGNTITVSPALSAAPADQTFVYVGTTAAALGQNGILKYKYPVPNKRFFQDQESIDAYGFFEAEPIKDPNLTSRDDLIARWNAFKEANAQPKISGSVTFQMTGDENLERTEQDFDYLVIDEGLIDFSLIG